MTKSTEGWDWSRRSERRDFWWDSSETTGCTVNLLIRVGEGGEGREGREGKGRGGEGRGGEGRGGEGTPSSCTMISVTTMAPLT